MKELEYMRKQVEGSIKTEELKILKQGILDKIYKDQVIKYIESDKTQRGIVVQKTDSFIAVKSNYVKIINFLDVFSGDVVIVL